MISGAGEEQRVLHHLPQSAEKALRGGILAVGGCVDHLMFLYIVHVGHQIQMQLAGMAFCAFQPEVSIELSYDGTGKREQFLCEQLKAQGALFAQLKILRKFFRFLHSAVHISSVASHLNLVCLHLLSSVPDISIHLLHKCFDERRKIPALAIEVF